MSGAVSVVAVFWQVKSRLFPPSALAGLDAASPDRAAIARAELVVRRGIRTVRWPMMFLGLAAAFIANRLPSVLLSAIALSGGLAIGLGWYMIATRRWWRWALGQGADMRIVQDLAEDVTLVWRRDSWFGRRQRRTWMRFPPPDAALEPTPAGERRIVS